MDLEHLRSVVERLQAKYVDVWEEICNIESPTMNKAAVDKVGEYCIRLAKERGWAVETFEHSVSGNAVCITMNPDATLPPVCLSGHMDTVHPIGLFGYPPVKKDAEKIYGPGVTDCKGGIVAGLLAMEALQTCGFTKRPVKMLLQADEEISSAPSNKQTIRYICEKAKGAIAFFNLESNMTGKVCLQRKGILNFLFTVTGQEAHSSMCAVRGANAIADAAHKILELEKFKDHDGLTCSCGVINGGSVPNTVAGACQFKVNVRFANDEQREYITRYVETLAKTEHVKGCSCKLEKISERIAMELLPRNVALFDRLNEIFAVNGVQTLEHQKTNGGSDAAYITAAGIPCIDSLGVLGGGTHSPQEFAYLSSLTERAIQLAVATYYL